MNDGAHDEIPDQAFGGAEGARWGGGMFAQNEAQPPRRGFVGSASSARADEAAWRQQLARKDSEEIATKRRFGGRVW